MPYKIIVFFAQMKIAIFSKAISNHSKDDLDNLFSVVNSSGFEYVINSKFAEKAEDILGINIPSAMQYTSLKDNPKGVDFLICYGGDGTFLKGVSMVYGTDIPILGINSGRLGFLANVSKDSISEALNELKERRYSIESRSMIEVKGDFNGGMSQGFAFNEFTIQRSGAGMITVDSYIADEMLGRYWGDGIILATPSGSTAYSLSVGAPIISPQCNCFVLSPIAPHNLSMRPIVLPDTAELNFEIDSRDAKAFVTIDNNTYSVESPSQFHLRRAEKDVLLVKLNNNSFYQTLRNKLMWGIDRRND